MTAGKPGGTVPFRGDYSAGLRPSNGPDANSGREGHAVGRRPHLPILPPTLALDAGGRAAADPSGPVSKLQRDVPRRDPQPTEDPYTGARSFVAAESGRER